MCVRIPNRQPLCTQAEDQADTKLLAPVPPVGIPQGLIATPEGELLQTEQAFKFRRVPSGDAMDLADLGGNLTGVLRDIKARDAADTGTTLEQVVSDVRV